jgi:hypothetical protein
MVTPPGAALALVGFALALPLWPAPVQDLAQRRADESRAIFEQYLDEIGRAQGLPLWPGDPPLSVETARGFLGADCFKERGPLLRRMGERAFPAFEAIISDPKSEPLHVSQALGNLCGIEGNRDRFRELAVRRLTDPDAGVRQYAAKLLGVIGGERDAAPIVALLADEKTEVSYAAAKALVAIGEGPTVVAMGVWLNSGNHREDRGLREHVAKCRDELRQRLEKAKPPTK